MSVNYRPELVGLFGCPVEDVKRFIGLIPGEPKVVGLGFMDILRRSGWDKEVRNLARFAARVTLCRRYVWRLSTTWQRTRTRRPRRFASGWGCPGRPWTGSYRPCTCSGCSRWTRKRASTETVR